MIAMLTIFRQGRRTKKHNSRGKEKGVEHDLKAEELFKIWEYHTDENGITHCAYCGNELYWNIADDHHRDTLEHRESVHMGGGSTAPNIIPADAYCNSHKGSDDFMEWFSAQEFYTEERFEKIVDTSRLITNKTCIHKIEESNLLYFIDGDFRRLQDLDSDISMEA